MKRGATLLGGRLEFVGAAAALLSGFASLAQPLTPTGPKTTQQISDFQAMIAADAELMRKNRWAFQSSLMTSIIETTQNVTVNKGKTTDLKFLSMESYINSGDKPVEISKPKFTASGKVTVSPSPLSPPPAPASTPGISIYFRVFAQVESALPRQSSPATVWSSEFAFTYSGYGVWSMVAQSPDSAFTTLIAPGDAIRINFEVESAYDTTLADGIVDYSLLSSPELTPELPELAFSSQWLEVPVPGMPITSLWTCCVLARRRR